MYDSLELAQINLIGLPLDTHIFLEGPAGCGKTTAGVERLLSLMERGIPGSQILIILPQRTLGGPYFAALHHPGVTAGGMVSIVTVGGLAQRMVDLFWPLAAEAAGFHQPDRLPVFLTLETAQYYMAHLVRPKMDEGFFESVVMDRNRLYSQILDNLNKSAVVRFPYTEIGERLKSAWLGEPGQVRIYDDVQTCATLFRSHCLRHNLLDFSLQIEIFLKYLWPHPLVRDYLQRTYRHLIVDNIEEDTPAAHDLLMEWLPSLQSALIIYDWHAGYRSYLGADPQGAHRLKELCQEQVVFEQSFTASPEMELFAERLAGEIRLEAYPIQVTGKQNSDLIIWAIEASMEILADRFYPQMLDMVAQRIRRLVYDENFPPGEIVVLAPFLSDALRFSLMNRLQALNVPVHSHRPSRSLREEPVTLCLLTLAMLAHPEWGFIPTRFDVAYALVQAIEGLDLVRAQLLVDIVYRIKDGKSSLASFDLIDGEIQERITYRIGERYEQLIGWIAYRHDPGNELDYFFSRLFGEVLSQPGFGFHTDYNAGQVTANLIESIQKFRWVAGDTLVGEGISLGKEYLQMVQDGVIAAQYMSAWQDQLQESVLLAPAYTFLMMNRPVRIQFWLDAGSRGWGERLEQPLTHPYVLSRNWQAGRKWTDADELEASQQTLDRLVTGLLHRCREKVFLGISQLGEQGYEQRGPLIQAVQRVLRHTTTQLTQ